VSETGDGSAPQNPRLAPMGIGSVFEVSVRIFRRHFAVLLPLSLLFVGPAALLTASTGVRFNEVVAGILPVAEDGFIATVPIALTEAELERFLGATGAFLLATSFAGALGTIAALGFSTVVGADYVGAVSSVVLALRSCLRGALAVIGMVIVTTAITLLILVGGALLIAGVIAGLSGGNVGGGGIGVFVALIVGVAMVLAVIFLTMRWATAVPAIALDGSGVLDALRRSWHLTTDNLMRTIAIVVLGTLVTAILTALLAQLFALVFVDLLATQLGLDTGIAEALSVAAASVMVAPLMPLLLAVLYHDLKVRRDSWEPA
jgi:hypothetical protein